MDLNDNIVKSRKKTEDSKALAPKKLSKEPFSYSEDGFFKLTDLLNSAETMVMRHSTIESIIANEGREVLRRLFEEHIDLRDLGDLGNYIVGSDGIVRNHKRVRERILITIFGEIKIKRIGYSSRGHTSLFPKDAILNLPEDIYSYGIRKLVAQEAAKSPFSEVVCSVKQITGICLSKSAAEILASKAAVDFDAFYAQKKNKGNFETQQPPLLVLTTDGKGIVMRREDLRDATKKRAEKVQHKLKKRQSKGEKTNAKRMATVASVYYIDRFSRSPEQILGEMRSTGSPTLRPRPSEKRVWASIEKTSEAVVEDIFAEALRRDPDKQNKWVCLIDGDPRQLRRIQNKAKKSSVNLTIVMDIIHVIEYLWKAARVFYAEASSKAEEWVTQRLLSILNGNAGQVAAGMRRSATLRGISKEARGPIDKCSGYLLKNKNYLNYKVYLENGFPIATGIIEGACRHLIKDRMDVTGARWSLTGAEAIVKLRSLRSSGDFEQYWQFHEEQEYKRNYSSQYADATILDKLLRNEF